MTRHISGIGPRYRLLLSRPATLATWPTTASDSRVPCRRRLPSRPRCRRRRRRAALLGSAPHLGREHHRIECHRRRDVRRRRRCGRERPRGATVPSLDRDCGDVTRRHRRSRGSPVQGPVVPGYLARVIGRGTRILQGGLLSPASSRLAVTCRDGLRTQLPAQHDELVSFLLREPSTPARRGCASPSTPLSRRRSPARSHASATLPCRELPGRAAHRPSVQALARRAACSTTAYATSTAARGSTAARLPSCGRLDGCDVRDHFRRARLLRIRPSSCLGGEPAR